MILFRSIVYLPLVLQKLKLSELGRLSTEEFRAVAKLPYIVVLDNVRSMHNVGSVFRTADAFRCQKLYLCGITGVPPHREITKTAIGAEKSVDWEYREAIVPLLLELKEKSFKIFAVEQTKQSQQLQELNIQNANCVFVFGNEIDGVSEEVIEICDACIEIPQAGTKHSLNISVAAGIVLWQYVKDQLSYLPS